MHPISFLVGKDKITCKECKGEIDLTTKEWTAFLKKFEEALKDLQPLYDSLP